MCITWWWSLTHSFSFIVDRSTSSCRCFLVYDLVYLFWLLNTLRVRHIWNWFLLLIRINSISLFLLVLLAHHTLLIFICLHLLLILNNSLLVVLHCCILFVTKIKFFFDYIFPFSLSCCWVSLFRIRSSNEVIYFLNIFIHILQARLSAYFQFFMRLILKS